MRCQNCHEIVPDSAKVCGHCGTKLDEGAMVPCPSCGEDVPTIAKVCGYCGTRLTESSTKPEPIQPAQKPKKPQKVKSTTEAKAVVNLSKNRIKKEKQKKAKKTTQREQPHFKIPLWGWIAAVAAAALLLILFVIPGNKESSMVYFWCEQETVPAGNEIFVYYYWGAKKPEQVDAYFDVAEHYLSVNGVWYKIRNAGLDEVRYDEEDSLYKRRYWMNIGTLNEPGWYNINTIIDITGYVFDGSGYSGPGTDNPRIDVTCPVKVVE